MRLIIFYIGMVLAGYALFYADFQAVLVACALFAQATGILLVATRPKKDHPDIAFGMVFGMVLYITLAFSEHSYDIIPLGPVIAGVIGGILARLFLTPKAAF
jgi:uncharacterized membrane protein YjjB (DUF3815 family)